MLLSIISKFSTFSNKFLNCDDGSTLFPIANSIVSKNLNGCAVPSITVFDSFLNL